MYKLIALWMYIHYDHVAKCLLLVLSKIVHVFKQAFMKASELQTALVVVNKAI